MFAHRNPIRTRLACTHRAWVQVLAHGVGPCCTLILLANCVHAQTPTPKPEARPAQQSTARELYGQAAKALVAKDIAQATVALTSLVEQFPQDDMAPLAAMRLAQCHLSAARSTEAIAVLEKWLPELSKSTKARTLDPAAELDAQAMLGKAYLMTSQYDRVIELSKKSTALAANPAALSEAQQRALQQLAGFASAAIQRRAASEAGYLREAARLVREKQYTLAQVELDKVDVTLLGADWSWRYYVLCAQCQLGSGHATGATEQLDHIELASLQPKEQSVVRMLRMEAALASGAHAAAEKELEALSATAQTDAHQAATLDLRRAELALLRKDRSTVEQLARAAKAKYPNFESLHEFDLLLARNLLARIEFDEARRVLTSLVQSPPARDPTGVPRAQWLLGESYLLSQEYQSAIAEYSRVIDGNRAPLWTESALMQRGKCYEMLGHTAEAQSDYNRLMKAFPTSSLQADARSRLGQLASGQLAPAEPTSSLNTSNLK